MEKEDIIINLLERQNEKLDGLTERVIKIENKDLNHLLKKEDFDQFVKGRFHTIDFRYYRVENC